MLGFGIDMDRQHLKMLQTGYSITFCYPLLTYMVGMMAHEAPLSAVASFQIHMVYVS